MAGETGAASARSSAMRESAAYWRERSPRQARNSRRRRPRRSPSACTQLSSLAPPWSSSLRCNAAARLRWRAAPARPRQKASGKPHRSQSRQPQLPVLPPSVHHTRPPAQHTGPSVQRWHPWARCRRVAALSAARTGQRLEPAQPQRAAAVCGDDASASTAPPLRAPFKRESQEFWVRGGEARGGQNRSQTYPSERDSPHRSRMLLWQYLAWF